MASMLIQHPIFLQNSPAGYVYKDSTNAHVGLMGASSILVDFNSFFQTSVGPLKGNICGCENWSHTVTILP